MYSTFEVIRTIAVASGEPFEVPKRAVRHCFPICQSRTHNKEPFVCMKYLVHNPVIVHYFLNNIQNPSGDINILLSES